jgi:hypothetical protein
LVPGAGTNPAREGQTAREIVPGTAPPDRILAGKRYSLRRAPATPARAGQNSTDQTGNRAIVSGRKEQGAWDLQIVDAGELRFRSCRRSESRKTKREKRKGRRLGEEKDTRFFYG